MCDDFFDDNFDDDIFMNDEPDEPEDNFDVDSEPDVLPDEIDNEFTAKDAFFIGGAMGFAYEEGLRERKRRKLKKSYRDRDAHY